VRLFSLPPSCSDFVGSRAERGSNEKKKDSGGRPAVAGVLVVSADDRESLRVDDVYLNI
jgi:hypothetical protein